jgi:RNA polymerase sigma-70 factor (ECF subfamily)
MNQAQFVERAESHRKELQLHCYRMLGSALEAEDLVQETLLRAWRGWDSYRGAASPRTWLYRIATNACLDHLRKHPSRSIPQAMGSPGDPEAPFAAPPSEPVWLEPYPDDLLPDGSGDPEARYALRESVSLAFQVSLQNLPPRQRAALILCDVLDWNGQEVADLLDTTVSAVNSALYRARLTMAGRHPESSLPPLDLDARQLLDEYVDAWQRADVDGLVDLLAEDARLAMPPTPSWFLGRASIAKVLSTVAFASRRKWRLVPTGSNLQPAFVFYEMDPNALSYRATGVQVLTLAQTEKGPKVFDVTVFMRPELSDHFRQPATLPE